MTRFGSIRRALAGAAIAALVACTPAFVAAVSAQAKTTTLEWDYIGASLEVVNQYVQAVTIDGVAVATVPACRARTGAPGDTTCSVTVPALSSGSHTFNVSATFKGITSSTTVSGADPSQGPASASAPRLVIHITIALQ